MREARGIPGTSVRTAFLCRDKPAMKQALREAGVACAQSCGVTSVAEAREFAEQVGFRKLDRDGVGPAVERGAGKIPAKLKGRVAVAIGGNEPLGLDKL